MTDKTITDLAKFAGWARTSKLGAVAIYHYSVEAARHEELFTFARALHDKRKVLLFQRRDGQGNWEHCALRISATAFDFIDTVSAMTPAPYNRYAPLKDMTHA
jgi:hypothetical protein